MKYRYLFLVLPLVVLWFACGQKAKHQSPKWSERFAEAVVLRNDSLVRYNNETRTKWQYDFAMLGQAMVQVDPKYKSYHKDYVDCFISDSGTIKNYNINDYNLDHINPGKGLFEVYRQTGDEKYRLAIELLMNHVKLQPRTVKGGYWHKNRYQKQVWLNSAFMVAPFMAQYALEFNQPQWFDSACHMLVVTNELLLDSTDGLHFHACDLSQNATWADNQTGCSPNKWLRATGWYFMALVDVLELLPSDHPQRVQVETILRNASASMLRVRDPKTKLWFQIPNLIDSEYNFVESSGSAMLVYAFAKGVRLGVLPAKYKRVAKQSFNQLVKQFVIVTDDQLPTLTGITVRSGLGGPMQLNGSFDAYINQQFIDNDARGLAPFILAALELGE
jgi:unsaturated rhamnogalacturonyl hydrolase